MTIARHRFSVFLCFFLNWTLVAGFFVLPMKAEGLDKDEFANALTVAISLTGRFSDGYSWHLSVNSGREAVLVIDSVPEITIKRFEVPFNEYKKLQKLLREQEFFSLDSRYGERVFDDSELLISITYGRDSNSVRLYYLLDLISTSPEKLIEPDRALRVAEILFSWIENELAADLDGYINQVISAADRAVLKSKKEKP